MATEPSGEIGNQLNTTRTIRTSMYSWRSEQTRVANARPSQSARCRRSSTDTSTSTGVIKYTWWVTFSIWPSPP